MVDEVREIAAIRDASAPTARLEAGISTAFGCTLQGAVPEDEVIRLAVQCVEAGADEVGLSDTVGYANPAQVRRLFRRLRAEIGARAGAAHMHNTRRLGLANCLAAYEEGVRTFDSSQGGLGGCPYAPGASGNVVTEDLVFMFEAMGVATGIDLSRLRQARAALQAGLPGEPLYGTRANQVWRAPLLPDGSVSKMGAFRTFFGTSGPDGLAATADGGLVVAHASLGRVPGERSR
jgi:hydroxymethylglutaryl-CoA lyase